MNYVEIVLVCLAGSILYFTLVWSRIDWHGAIKVADFGLTEDMYGTNYFRRRKSETASEEKVPIRWMAPESIENDIYNESTDVVSTHAWIFASVYHVLTGDCLIIVV